MLSKINEVTSNKNEVISNKIALCFIINYEHILTKEHIWREWIEFNKDIINVYFFYENIERIHSPWIKEHAIPLRYILPTQYYYVVPAYISIMKYAYEHYSGNKWFCLLTDACCPIVSPSRFRSMFIRHWDHSIFSHDKCHWNVSFHKRANLYLFPKEFHLSNDPWFILTREHVYDCLAFTRNKIFKTVCQGILANESIFAIIMKTTTSIDKPKKILNKHSHLTDWSRMTSTTSPHVFIEGNQRDLDFIDKGLRENEYAMFLRKVSSRFPDDILRNLLYNTNNDCLKEEDIFKGKGLEEVGDPKSFPKGSSLAISSLFFLIPSIYAGTHHVYSLSLLSAVTSAVSVIYWHDPKLGWRRNLDLVFAKISFCIYFGCGLYNIPKNENMLYFSAVMILICYGISNYFWIQKIRYWVYVHMIFHMFVALGQFTVVDGRI